MARKMKNQRDWVATSRADGASQHTLRTRSCLVAAAVSVCFVGSLGNQAFALPTNPVVANGSASFAQNGNVLNVTNSNGAIINWNTFSIGANETTRFIQASSSSSVLNRVLSANPSVLLGSLTSNGRVFLINPSGILVGQGARIDVAGFVASTLNLSNANFLANKLQFDATPGAGSVINQGSITTPTGGSVYLVAPNVSNEGIITTPQGETLLAAGQTVTLLDTGTPGVSVEITGAEGNATNLGTIVADAGRIGIAGVLVRSSGTLSASSAVNVGGSIFLKASQDAYVDGDGRIVTTGTKGGTVEVLGNRVAVMDNASIEANGASGGGTVLVGGDYQGKNAAIQNSTITYFGPNATIIADATNNGNGGKVIIWADDTTRAYGKISAKGGPNGGNGGFIETSGHVYLDVAGIQAVASAAKGLAGTWLLDPSDITITHGSGFTQLTSYGGVFSPSQTDGSASTLSDSTINSALYGGTTVVVSTNSSGTGTGDITINGDVLIETPGGSSSYHSTFGLHADHSINMKGGAQINDSIYGGLNVYMAADHGSVTIAGTIDVTHYGGGPAGQVWIGAHDQIFDRNTGDTTGGIIKANEVHLASLYGGAAGGLAISANTQAEKIYAFVGEPLGWGAPYTFFNGGPFYSGSPTIPAPANGGIRIDNSGVNLSYAYLVDRSLSGGNIAFTQHQGDLSLDLRDGTPSYNGSIEAQTDSGDIHLNASAGNIVVDCGSGYCGHVGVGKTFFLNAMGNVSFTGVYGGYSHYDFKDTNSGWANLDIQAGGNVDFGYEAFIEANHVQIGSQATPLGGNLNLGSYGGISAHNGVDIFANGNVNLINEASYGYAFIHSYGGDINITASSINIENDSYNGYAEIGVIGGSGNVNVTATGPGGINITNDGQYGYAGIFSDNGNVSVTSSGTGNISIKNFGVGGTAGIYSASGNVTVSALHGSISIGSYGYSYNGDGGNAGIAAYNGNVTVSAAGNLDIVAENNTNSFYGGGYTHAGIFTYGGSISVTAGSISLTGYGSDAQAGIVSGVDFNNSNFNSSGTGGNVSVTSHGDILMAGNSQGSAEIDAFHGNTTVGAAGNVTIEGLTGYAGVFADYGNVSVTAGGDVSLLGPGGYSYNTGAEIAAFNYPGFASATIVSGGAFHANGGHVFAQGYGGASVGIAASDVLLENGSSITAFAYYGASADALSLSNVNIVSNKNIVLNNGSSIAASNDVILTLNQATSKLVLNESEDMAPSFIWSDKQMPQLSTTVVNFTTRSSGGIVINGAATTTTAGSGCAVNQINCLPGSGFFAGQFATPSALGNGLEIHYGSPDNPAGVVIDQFFANLTKIGLSDDDKKKKDENNGNEGKDKDEHNQSNVGQCT